jgi:hypothetical protein
MWNPTSFSFFIVSSSKETVMKELMRKGFSSLLFECTAITFPDQLKEGNHYATRWILISQY